MGSIFFDQSDADMDGNGWVVREAGAVVARFSTQKDALIYLNSQPIEPLEVGEVLINGTGAIVLDYCWRMAQNGEEPGKHGVLVAMIRENPHDPYVVWNYFRRLDGTVHTFNGDYFSDLVEAIGRFVKRRKRFVNGN
jgi:hypothetical protein